ncbi:uncharacterized protein K02A2.6-like [Nematostella vectensis]|uniref:uncharacterized protein K02A2.6-like n=1 Tax=Nematostella vectensis TaxID=45351 RepID=UPI0020775375|nr:uncharacterized protein K02A2.6-like [Nematostella vectensis]
MKGTDFPERPWSKLGADFFQYEGRHYLHIIYYYSRDIEIYLVSKNVTACDTVNKMKNAFSRHGIPDILVTDNGPQFASAEFNKFAATWGFDHITSSPRYAQSNGESEGAVETIKNFLKKCDDEYLALLSYRNTPLHNGYSPSQLSMGRKLKTRVPCHPDELKPQLPDNDVVRRKEREHRRQMREDYDRRHRVAEGEKLAEGDRVWIPDLKTEGTIIRPHETPRSVVIQTPKGLRRRNRRQVRRALGSPQPTYAATQYRAPILPERYTTPEAIQSQSSPLPVQQPSVSEKETFNEMSGPTQGDGNRVPQPCPTPEQPTLRRSERVRRRPRRYIEEY